MDALPIAELPQKQKLLTMLFTDIVGSTELKQRLGDRRAMEVFEWHQSTLRSTANEFDSEEVTTAGDSFFLTFEKPSDAVRFAISIQRIFRSAASDRTVQVSLRVGLHARGVRYGEGSRSQHRSILAGVAFRSTDEEVKRLQWSWRMEQFEKLEKLRKKWLAIALAQAVPMCL